MDAFFLAKWLHILSATVLFGTGIGTAFQMVWAMHTRRVETIHSVTSGVVIADWMFTTPAGLFQPASGLWLIWLQGYSLWEPWLILTYILFIIALFCWLPVVRLQIRIRNLAARALADGTDLASEVWRLYRWWFILGWPAFLGLTGVFWLMVSKPDLGF